MNLSQLNFLNIRVNFDFGKHQPSGSPSTWINFNAHEKKILVPTLPAAQTSIIES